MVPDLTERKQTEEQREGLLRDMQERVKELRCIYGVAKSTQTRNTLEEMFQDTVALIPPAWQYPEITRARICFDGKEYVSEVFQETPWKQVSNIVVAGKKQGIVEVYYVEEQPELDEGPFLKEERHLLEGIAHSLSVAIERKWAEEALRLAEADYRSIFDNAIEGIYRVTEEGRFLTANPALARMLGYASPEDLIQSVANIRDQLFVDPRQRDKFMRLLLSNDSVWGFEARLYRRDGRMIWTLENARAVRDPKGRLLYYEGTTQDITTRKEAEETLHRLSGRLLKVQDEERRRIARELHDGVAQELVGLKMELSTLRKPALRPGPKARRVLSRVLRSVTRSVRNIRTLSHLLHPPELDELGLAPVLSSYVAGFSARSGIRVDLDIPGRLGRLPQDVETALFRIVQESLANVHRHARSRTAKVRVCVRPGEVSVEIADKGLGICSEDLERIRAGGASLGVGIAGMQERVKQLGGKLVITSSRGTRVRVIIPLCEDTG